MIRAIFLVFLLAAVGCKQRDFNSSESAPEGVEGKSGRRTFSDVWPLESVVGANGVLVCMGAIDSEVVVWKTGPKAKDCKSSLPKSESQMVKLRVEFFFHGTGLGGDHFIVNSSGQVLGQGAKLCVGEFDSFCSINIDGEKPIFKVKKDIRKYP